MYLIIFGFLIHCVFLLSIFDIYFKSPIIHGIPVLANKVQPPSKRLVLFSTDGVRADSFYTWNLHEYGPTYTRSIIEERGVWGVSHTRVPTESRPGHVALIAGIYEDPSAIFKGWKENPVEFDSVFNRSFVTYSWGSPDILPIFSKGAPEGKMYTFMYSSDIEDFSGVSGSASSVSTWVFNKVEEFFKAAVLDVALKQMLESQGVVFFLHLLGPDIAGHADKPHSYEYKENIMVIDRGVKQIEELVSEFYNHDNKTAFILTSDHGMTDWGSHGAGTAHETETPLVMWGAGVSAPRKAITNNSDTPPHWKLEHLVRRDINQADLVPLMATLLGISIPVNSVGKLPQGLLNLSDHDSSLALAQNAFQLAAQYGRKRDIVQTGTIPWLYRPFLKMTNKEEAEIHNNIRELIQKKEYSRASLALKTEGRNVNSNFNVSTAPTADVSGALNHESERLIELSLSGLNYYHNYYQGLLLGCITLSFLGWILWLCCMMLPQEQQKLNKPRLSCKHISGGTWFKPIPDLVFLILHVTAVVLIYVQALPLQFYIYCCLPLWLWWVVGRKVNLIISSVRIMKIHPLYLAAICVLYLIGIELLVLSFFHRWVLSVIMCVLSLWPFGKQDIPKLLVFCWLISTLVLAVFPALPVVGSKIRIPLVYICGWLWVGVGLLSVFLLNFYTKDNSMKLSLLKLILQPLTIWIIMSTTKSFDAKHGLPLLNQILSWLFLFLSLLLPFTSSTLLLSRLVSIGLAFAIPYLLLCTGHESFFLLALFLNLIIWLAMEVFIEKHQSKLLTTDFQIVDDTTERKHLTSNDFRRASFFLVYIVISFFGTGNIASINSFDPSWVHCFLTVFSPFTMSTLILLKTIIPFFLVSCTFRALNIITKASIQQLFLIVLMLSDIMGLHFLYAVTNQGSWLDIGTSISHYVIVQATTLFIVILYGLATLYTRFTVWNIKSNIPKYQSLESKPFHIQTLPKKRHFE